jgi:Tfp pilus assembly protein PilE
LRPCGFGGIFVIGILAAIAIPKFASVSRSARAAEAEVVLKQIHSLQQIHHDSHGAYTANLDDAGAGPPLTGWVDPGARYFTFWVSEATDDELCVEARPTTIDRAAGLVESSMDHQGNHYLGAGCTGTIISNHRADVSDGEPTDAGS